MESGDRGYACSSGMAATFAESLGGAKSFVTYPATQTHADIPKEERIKRGICDRLLRFSVGVEQAEDLKADLKQALNKVKKIEKGCTTTQ